MKEGQGISFPARRSPHPRWVLPVLVLLLGFLGPGSLNGQSQAIPTPESVLGFRPGADFQLASYEESLAYFQRLDAASDHLTLLEIGRTSEDRPFFVALISSSFFMFNPP